MYNNEISFSDKLEFIKFEVSWAREKKDAMVAQATNFLVWIGAAFAFTIVFTDIEDIIDCIRRNNHYTIKSCLIFMLIIICFVGIVMCIVCAIKYILLLKVKDMENIDIDDYENGFLEDKIVSDYKKVLKDYDDVIAKYGKCLKTTNPIMCVGIGLMVIAELVMKILITAI